MAMTNPITDFLLNTGLTAVVLVGAVWVNAGRMQRGQIVAFLTYFTLIQSATLGIAKVFVRVSKGRSLRPPYPGDPPGAHPAASGAGGGGAARGAGHGGGHLLLPGGGAGPGPGQLQAAQGETLGIWVPPAAARPLWSPCCCGCTTPTAAWSGWAERTSGPRTGGICRRVSAWCSRRTR